MNRTKYLKGECQHCSGHMEFPAEHIGMIVACPHCGQDTELLLAQPAEEPSIPKRAIVWTIVAIVVLCLGLGAALIALRRAQRWAATQKRQATSTLALPEVSTSPPQTVETNSVGNDSLQPSAVSLEHSPGTSLIYATGTIKNTSSRQRFGVKVELELADAAGQKIGTATDYRQVMEPGADWQFKALVVDAKTQSAKIIAIREDQ